MTAKERIYEVIFEADTRAGKLFDVSLLMVILLSIGVVMLESVPRIKDNYQAELRLAEWLITALFSIEYLVRILVVKRPLRYIKSFYGIIDLVSVLPTYLSLFIAGAQGLIVVRALRLLRIFRILKLSRLIGESTVLVQAMKASRHKIGVFFYAVVMIVIILGAVMYLIEGSGHGFTSIPKSIYWAVVTLTTVGYGDISPETALGQFIASLVMILGYAIIAVPTGIITSEISTSMGTAQNNTQVCPSCLHADHDDDAKYCKHCGEELHPD